MQKRKPEMLIPVLYFLILIGMNILAFVFNEMIDIVDPVMKMIRISSIINIGFYGTLFILYIILFLPAWKSTIAHFIKHRKSQLIIVLVGFVSMFGMMFVMGTIYTIIGVTASPENQVYLEAQLAGPFFDKAVLVIFAVVLAPLVEEMLFRLAGFRLFKKIPRLPNWAVIVLTSLLFGGIHVLGDDLVQILYYAGLGAILGTVYLKSNNIIAPIAVHMLFNGFVTITMFMGI